MFALRSSLRFVTMSLVRENKNNGDKLYRRKSTRAADEKLIINELRPYTEREPKSKTNGGGRPGNVQFFQLSGVSEVSATVSFQDSKCWIGWKVPKKKVSLISKLA